ncbi:hypothetical protein GCM10020216_068810 [Nonomuraea helvata]
MVDQPNSLDLRVVDLPDDAGDRRLEQRIGQRRETFLCAGQRNDLHPKGLPCPLSAPKTGHLTKPLLPHTEAASTYPQSSIAERGIENHVNQLLEELT